ELPDDVVAVGDDRPDQLRTAVLRAKRCPVARTEPLVGRVFGPTGGTDLHGRSVHAYRLSTRRTWSPTRTRCPGASWRSPCTASATPLRLPASWTKNSASSLRISAWRPLIVGSYGNTQSPDSRPSSTLRAGERWKVSRTLPSARSCSTMATSAVGTIDPIRRVASASGGCGPG